MSIQSLAAQVLGWLPTNTAVGAGRVPLNGASVWLDIAFRTRFLQGTKKIVKLRVFQAQTIGTAGLGPNDLLADVYADSNGLPAASLQSVNTLTSPAAYGTTVEFTGFACTVSAQTQYHIVLRNANASPTTSYPTYTVWGAGGDTMPPLSGNVPANGMFALTSADGGKTWSQLSADTAGNLQIVYDDGSVDGLLLPYAQYSGGIYGPNEYGVKFTSPAAVALRIAALSASIHQTGAPQGQAYFKLYIGDDPPVSTSAIAINSSFHGWTPPLYFPGGTVIVPPNTVCRLTIADTAADGASNCYAGDEAIVDGNSLAMLPFAGTWQRTQTADGGSTWTDTPTIIEPFALVLDSGAGFATPPPVIDPNAFTLEQGLLSYLNSVPGITSQAAGRVYPAPAPEDPTYPLIVYQRISTTRVRSLQGPAQLAKARMQINAYAQGYAAAKTLADEIRNALDCYQGTLGSINVSGCFLEDDADTFDIEPENLANRVYGVRMDFLIGYQETLPAYN